MPLKENVGKLTGDKKLESEGAVEKTTAKVKDVVEDVKDAVERAHFDRLEKLC